MRDKLQTLVDRLKELKAVDWQNHPVQLAWRECLWNIPLLRSLKEGFGVLCYYYRYTAPLGLKKNYIFSQRIKRTISK